MDCVPVKKQIELLKYLDMANGALKEEFHQLRNYVQMKVMAEDMINIVVDEIISKGEQNAKDRVYAECGTAEMPEVRSNNNGIDCLQ